MREERSTSPWLYIGLGCILAVVLLVATVVGLGWVAVRQAHRFAEEMQDPEARGAKVQEVLGYQQLPPGYHPAVSFSVPMLMRVAILTDRAPGPEGQPDFGSRSFVFLDMREFGEDQEEVRAYLEGHGERPRMFDRTNISVGTQRDLGSPRAESLARGAFEEEGVEYLWSAHPVDLHGREGWRAGVETLILVECPRQDRRVRLAVWAGPLMPDGEGVADESPQGDLTPEIELAGTPADEESLRGFLGHLRLCPA